MLFLMVSGGLLRAESSPIRPDVTAPGPGRALWKASLASMAAAQAMDLHSSWGKRELNPVLADRDCKFNRQGALIKVGLQGGLMGLEYLVTRGHPSRKLYRALSVINFGAAAGTAAVAAHNYSVPRP